jgi:hypothetical protein
MDGAGYVARCLRASAALIVIALLGACGGGSSDQRATEPDDDTGIGPALERLPPTPRPEHRRIGVLVVPAGPDVLLLGGREVKDLLGGENDVRAAPDGFIYREETNQWSKLDLPFSAPPYRPGVVSTGNDVIVVGTPCGKPIPDDEVPSHCPDASAQAAVYSSTTDDWEIVSPPPRALANPADSRRPFIINGIGWTGTKAVFQFRRNLVADFGIYEVEDDRWSVLPAMDGEPRNLCIAGDELLAVGLPQQPPPGVVGPGLGLFEARPGPLRTARYTATGAWEHLADQPLAAGTDPIATTMFQCQGREAIVSRWSQSGALNPLQWFDPSLETWSALPSPPEAFQNATPARDGTTRVLFTVGTKYWLLPDGASQWQGVPWDLCDEDTGIPDTCWPTPPRVQSHGDGVLLIESDNADIERFHITRLRPVQYAAEQAAGG